MSDRPPGRKKYLPYLNFEINKNPPWENSESFDEMIGYVVSRINEWKNRPDHISEPEVPQLLDDFILHMCHQEDAQMTTEVQRLHQQDENADIDGAPGRTVPKKDTLGMLHGLCLVRKLRTDPEVQEPLVIKEILCDFHKALMQHKTNSVAGRLSKDERHSHCVLKNVKIYYPDPEIVEETIPKLCDAINIMTEDLYEAAKSKLDESLLSEIIRFLAWSFLNLISLHPFGDGNGRWARLVFHYLHHILSPLPVSIYNVYSPTNKIDYYKALSSGRTEKQVFSFYSKPSDLAAMILSCEYYTWKKYDEIMSHNRSYYQRFSLSSTDSDFESQSQSQSPE